VLRGQVDDKLKAFPGWLYHQGSGDGSCWKDREEAGYAARFESRTGS
jgi:hypothetical protein